MPDDGPCAGQGGAQTPVNYIISSKTEMWDKQHWRRKNTVNNSNNIVMVVIVIIVHTVKIPEIYISVPH